MPIEFRCQQCGRLLRTPDNTAGKQAKCPECEAIVPIPEPGAAVPPPPQPPTGGGGAGGGFTTPPPPGSGSAFGPGAPVNPYESPHAPGAPAVQPVEPGAFRPMPIDMGDVLSRTWNIFTQQWGICLAAVIIVGIINVAASSVVNLVVMVFAQGVREPALAFSFAVMAHLAQYVVSLWLMTGQVIFFLKIARGQDAAIGDVFAGGPYLSRIVLTYLLFSMIVTVGIMLCIVPGVIFALMFSQWMYLIVDRNAGVTDSLSVSSEITRGNKWMLLTIAIVVGICSVLVVLLTCGLGLLAVGPYAGILGAVVYLAMTGQPTADQWVYGYTPPPPQQQPLR